MKKFLPFFAITIILCAPVWAAEKTPAELDADLWQIIKREWGFETKPEDIVILKGDITCDGVDDYVASRRHLSAPEEGPRFELLMISKLGDWNSLEKERFSFGFDATDNQYAICGNPETDPLPEVKIETYEAAQVLEMTGAKACTNAVAVVDGKCDTPRLFWSLEDKKQETDSRLILFRN